MEEKKKVRLRWYLARPHHEDLKELVKRKGKYIDYVHDNPNTEKAKRRRHFLHLIGVTDADIQRADGYNERRRQDIIKYGVDDEDLVHHIFSAPKKKESNSFSSFFGIPSNSSEDESEEEEEEDCPAMKVNFSHLNKERKKEELTIEEELFINDEKNVVECEDVPIINEWVLADEELPLVYNIDNIEQYFEEKEEKCDLCTLCDRSYEIQGKVQYNSITSADIETNYKYHIKNAVTEGTSNLAYLVNKYSDISSPHISKDYNSIIEYDDVCGFFDRNIRWINIKHDKEVYFLSATPPLQYYRSDLRYSSVHFFRGAVYPTFTFSDGTSFAYDLGDVYLLPFTTFTYVYHYDNEWYAIDDKNINGDSVLLCRGGLYYLLGDTKEPYKLSPSKPVTSKTIKRNSILSLISSYVDDTYFDHVSFFDSYAYYNSNNDQCIRVLLNMCGIFYHNDIYKLFNFTFPFEACTRTRYAYGICDCLSKYIHTFSDSNIKSKIT
jgi:hypothetical protein